MERLGQGGKKLIGSVSDGSSLNILARSQLSYIAATKVRRRRFQNAAVPTLRATEVSPALRREALFERSSCLDAPSGCRRVSSVIRRQDWPNLRHSALDHGFHFLHRLLVNGGDLRFGLIKDGLNLRLLFRGQVQTIGELMKAKCVPVRAPDPGPSLGLGHDKAAQGDDAGRYNC